jgi:hypothetical protein
MSRVVISKKHRHPLFFIEGINQVILDYLQYKESIELYEYFRCKEPERPTINTMRELYTYLLNNNGQEMYLPKEYEKEEVTCFLNFYYRNPSSIPPRIYYCIDDKPFEAYHYKGDNGPNKTLYIQCNECEKYNKVCIESYKNGKYSLIAYQIKYIIGKICEKGKSENLYGDGRFSLCDCIYNTTTGSYTITSAKISDSICIRLLLEGKIIKSPTPLR